MKKHSKLNECYHNANISCRRNSKHNVALLLKVVLLPISMYTNYYQEYNIIEKRGRVSYSVYSSANALRIIIKPIYPCKQKYTTHTTL